MSKSLRNAPLYLAHGIYAKTMTDVIDELNQNNQLYPITDDTRILIYEREVKYWFLDVALRLLKEDQDNEHTINGFVVLMIGLSYIEGVQQYKKGLKSTPQNGGSGQFFREGFREIFPNVNATDEQINEFYNDARCGLFHNGMVKSQTIISNGYRYPICFENADTIRINPYLFLETIQYDFVKYISVLKDDSKVEERNRFLAIFSID